MKLTYTYQQSRKPHITQSMDWMRPLFIFHIPEKVKEELCKLISMKKDVQGGSFSSEEFQTIRKWCWTNKKRAEYFKLRLLEEAKPWWKEPHWKWLNSPTHSRRWFRRNWIFQCEGQLENEIYNFSFHCLHTWKSKPC